MHANKYISAVEGGIEAVGLKIAARLRGQVESIIHFLCPFSGEGLLLVLSESVGSIPSAVAEIYPCIPPGVELYCLRKRELFQLGIPGQFLDLTRGTPSSHPQLAFWAKNKGSVIYGTDIRNHIPLPSNTRELLGIHIERCIFYLRNTRILQLLMRREYLALIAELDKHLRHVMATALLIHDEWAATPGTAPALFQKLFQDDDLDRIWLEFTTLFPGGDVDDESLYRRTAFEAVWLFESFLKRLEAYAQ